LKEQLRLIGKTKGDKPMISWQEDPRYQRALQKLQRMTPDQRAIVDSAMLDESFGDLETRRMIQSMQAGATKKYREKQLSLTSRGQAQQYELQKEGLALSKESFENRMRANQEMQGLKRKEFEFGKKQLPISTAIGVGDVLTSGYMGYQGMKQKQKLAQDYAVLARMYAGRGY